jgi:serine phosphatase RsbU (regulator of sigma subunit)/CHASE2 domain-containing sensor protein
MLRNGLTGAGQLSVRAIYWLIIFSVVAACIVVRQADPNFVARLRLLGFDILQQTLPRSPDPSYPVRIIDIDERSIRAFGSWPWRRDILADLVDKLFAAGVRVVVFDMVVPEASGSPIGDLRAAIRGSPEFKPLLDKLVQAGTVDDDFARSIKRHPTVLGIIGVAQAGGDPPKGKAAFATIGDNVPRFVPSFAGASGNLPAFESAAAGIGALNWLPDHDQILRRIPLVVGISNALYPSLAAETLRVFQRASTIRVRSAGDGGFAGNRGITTVAIGEKAIPTDRDGQLWLWFSRHDPRRTLSAADVLQEKAQQRALDGRIAIVGTSAPGLLDLRATPLDPVISGVEINAQAIEQLLSGRLLIRPDYAQGMEIVLTVVSALLLGYMAYRWGARVSAAVGFASVCVFSLGSVWAFSRGLLLDAVFPIMTSSAAYIFGTGYLYYEAEDERNRGREELHRIAREMEAAAQIQRAFLPKESPTGPLDHTFEVFAVMRPAKAVGGDFYDYFLINDHTLALAVGDVSGKGVPAALFMSVSRTVLRAIAFEGGDPGTVLSKVNLVLSRDNAESMFVTIFYAVLDLQTGVLSFSSAGHDDGLLLTRANACEPLRYMGPAIGLVETVDYPTETRSLSSGDTLLLLTDGITEAFNIDGRVFGPDSVVKSATQTQYTSAVDLVQSINDEVGRFSAGTVQSDDITCVGLRFKGRTLCT